MKYFIYPFENGFLFIVEKDEKISEVFLRDSKNSKVQGKLEETMLIKKAKEELDEYFNGERKIFSFPILLEGTPFQQEVWKAIDNIPYGQTMSYKDIAYEINRPRANRAVGTACGKNPLLFVIPCHRVLRADGSLGGYGYDISLKRNLLDLEYEHREFLDK